MWPDGFVFSSPVHDQHLGFKECGEDLSVEEFFSELPFVMFREVLLENFESDSGETQKITNIHRSFPMMKETDAIMALPLLFCGLKGMFDVQNSNES